MDRQTDEKPFGQLMDQFHAVYREGYPASEAWKAAMWNALKDVRFTEVKANAHRLMVNAKPADPLPRPASLRNRPQRPFDENAKQRSYRTWRDLRAADPVRFEIEFRAAHAETVLAGLPLDDPTVADWTAQLHRWRGLRYAPRAEQEATVKHLLGQQ